eukprot:TRINITY_DN18517_c0_g1_i2.p1 TRINITY_DN18517_c0_g1~~TRINITY_DN18517_c0_g1_i2.p1  ORF type:complete len:290 (+),score=59.25 TRINITY_DN18517_c0_g1_i2:91-960(+)
MASERAVLNDARDSALSEGKTYVVMSNGTADFKTVTDALRHCCEGDTILVKLGQYDEKIVLEKNVTIQGDSGTEPTDIIINGGAVCKVGGVIRGVAITSLVEIRSGSVTLEGCDISEGFDGIKICKGANPTILRCVIHNARQGGDCIYVAEGAKALIEDNEIHNARVNGIHVNGGDVILRKNRIHHCHFGIFFRRRGKGAVDGNTVQNCTTFGVYIIQSADPIVERNTISSCSIHGIMISQEGMGTIRNNMCNGSLTVKKGSVPQLENNQVLGKLDNENVQHQEVPALA